MVEGKYVVMKVSKTRLINALIEIEAIDSVDDLYVADELCVD